MIARKQEINLQVNQFIDAVLLGFVFWLAHFMRYHRLIILDNLWSIDGFDKFVWILAVIAPFGPFLLEKQGFYSHRLEKTPWRSLRQMASAGVWLFLILAMAVIFLRLEVPSRSVLILFGLMAPVVLLVRERITLFYYMKQLKLGAIGERIILAGEQASMAVFLGSLSAIQRQEIQIVEQIDLGVNDVECLTESLHNHSVGRVVLAFSRSELGKVERAIGACEIEGVEAWLNVDFIHTSSARPSYEVLAKRPMLVFRRTPDLSWAMLVKDAMDRVLAFATLVFGSPFLLAVALAVKLTSPGPVIFRQKRAGLHGRPFEMLKFRTMCSDAEEKRAALESLNTMRGPVFKVDDDPRITRLGRWLRRTSVDEFPQLFNVLRGEMSLVGPRPLPIYEVEKFELLAHRRRLSMKPGLTCIWQVKGRNAVTNFDDWVKMDLEYIDNWSLGLDFYLLFITVPVVFLGRGAK